MKLIKCLNLYAGLGGNRKLWTNVQVTAVELDLNIARAYKKLFPDDIVLGGYDAHSYLLKHYQEYDFIWSSPPCPSHSKLRLSHPNQVIYPDLTLYEEVILLKNWAKCRWVVENVKPYYSPLIAPSHSFDRHLFWTNFLVKPLNIATTWRTGKVANETALLEKLYGFDLSEIDGVNKRDVLRNCVVPQLGEHILESAKKWFS